MGEIVIVNGGTFNDVQAFLELADRSIALVEAELPGTIRYECFVDEAASRFVWHETFTDGAAILQHVQRFVEAGIVDGIMQLMEFDFKVGLGDVEPDVRAAMEQAGFGVHRPHAGATR